MRIILIYLVEGSFITGDCNTLGTQVACAYKKYIGGSSFYPPPANCLIGGHCPSALGRGHFALNL